MSHHYPADLTRELEDHDLGLSHDLPRILGRRRLLSVFGGVGVVALAGCASDGSNEPGATTSSSAAPPNGGAGAESEVSVAAGEIPEETAGPFPGDGSNGLNVLTESGIVRSDITSSFGSASGVAEGVPTTVRLTVYDLDGEAATALSGAAVYLWHCSREGEYSMYSEAVADENFLRGVQEADANGRVEFTTIFPGAYDGRWPHMHFEVYQSLADATSYANKLRTSQLAIPEETCREVYGAAEGYDASLVNLDATPLDSDMVFSDGYSLQMAKVEGSADDGYTLTLTVPV